MGRSILEVSCACSTSEWCGPTDAALSSRQRADRARVQGHCFRGRHGGWSPKSCLLVCSMMLVLTATIVNVIVTLRLHLIDCLLQLFSSFNQFWLLFFSCIVVVSIIIPKEKIKYYHNHLLKISTISNINQRYEWWKLHGTFLDSSVRDLSCEVAVWLQSTKRTALPF